MNTNGLLLVERPAKLTQTAQMTPSAASALIQGTLISYKKLVELFWATGQQTKFVALFLTMAPPSTATNSWAPLMRASPVGICGLAWAWALAISRALTAAAAAVLTGTRKECRCPLLPTLRNATTRTLTGLPSLNLASYGSNRHAPLHTHTHMMI